jgi:hypothetical protein
MPLLTSSPENRTAVRPNRATWLERAALLGAGAALLVTMGAVFSMIMRSYDHNESLYVTAGWLVAHGHRVYADFSFWQMPYAAQFYGIVFRLLEPTHFLLVGKIVAFGFWLAMVALFAAIVWRQCGHTVVALVATLLFALNPTIGRCATEASNYIQPIAFALASYWCALQAWRGERRAIVWWSAAGATTAIAIGFKLYYLPTVLAYLIAIGWSRSAQSPADRLRRGVLPFCGGLLIGLAPVAVIAARAPAAFWFNNVRAHGLTTGWWLDVSTRYAAEGRPFDLPLMLGEKIRFAGGVLGAPGNSVLLAGIALAVGLVARNAALRHPLLRPEHVLAALLTLTSVAAAFAPTPMWLQYWGLPLPFAFLWLSALLGTMIGRERQSVVWLLAGATAFVFVADGRTIGRNVRLLPRTEFWPGIVFAQQAREFAARVPPDQSHQTIATLQQLWAIESGRFEPINELAYAPFTYVIADRVPPDQRREFRLVGFADLSRFLAEKPPAAVLSGLYQGSFWRDDELTQWAEQHQFAERSAIPPLRFFTARSLEHKTSGSP